MNEISSTGTMIGSIHAGTPCGTNREKKCRPCRAKPTNRTVAKEISASIAVTVTWLVTVKAWTPGTTPTGRRSEEHTSELQSLMRISYAVFCLKKINTDIRT